MNLIVKDWSKVNIRDPKDRGHVLECLNKFLQMPLLTGGARTIQEAIQHFGQPGDFPASTLEILKRYQSMPQFDTVYEEIFDIIDMTGSKRNGFSIADVDQGIKFIEVPIGDKAKVFGMSGTKVDVEFILYGGGLQWHITLFDDEEYYTIENRTLAFRNRADYDRAMAYFTLIEALPAGQNVAWQAPTPTALPTTDANYMAVRDFNTINYAVQLIIADLKDKGYGIGMGTPFMVLAPNNLMPRMNRAFGIYNAGLAGTTFQGIQYNLSLRYTTCLTNSTTFYVILPKQKLVGGNRMNLTAMFNTDVLSYSQLVVGWQRFGGAIGNTKQLRRCAIS